MKDKLATFLALICFAFSASSQIQPESADIWQQKPKIILSGFLDVFYVYDFNKPITDFRQPFFYNHNRHNEFNLNLGFVKIAVEHAKYRAKFALHTGTYVADNYAAEPPMLQSINEANIGVSLNKKNNLWIDAGILTSHIGFESAISIDNWTLTRSILAENSPYFSAGAKLTYNPNSTWEIAALVLNGWQVIQRVPGNSLPSFGTQILHKPTQNIALNWSTFVGTTDPDSTRRMRYFNNFYGQFQLAKKLGIIAGFDIGAQQKSINSTAYNVWFSPVIIAQITLTQNLKTAFRAEYYQDEAGIIIPTNTQNGFKTTSFSWNFDYSPTANLACRIEGRWLKSDDNIFVKETSATNNNFFIAASLAVKFSQSVTKRADR